MAKASSLIGTALVVGVVFAACSPEDEPATTGAATTGATTSTVAPATTAPASTPARVAPAAAQPVFGGEPVTVSEVIDGDTFRTTDGREIRVLGIDSCEKETLGGRLATSAAELQLGSSYGSQVTLTSQSGVDTDRYGRHLRYVQYGTNHEDFGEYMVRNDHTGVYQGRHDASPDYVARLYAVDTERSSNPPSGRECGGTYDTTPPTSGNSYSYDGGDDVNMPDGALTGGYCARKWWC